MATRAAIVNQARSWVGRKEADGSHREIIDIYNNYPTKPRSYKVKYTDSWCATFVSAVAIVCNATDIIPLECSCGKMIQLFQKIGRWVENDNYTPAPGDVIFYDWGESGDGETTGWPEHVGIVEEIVGSNLIKVIEGNINDMCGRRTIAVGGSGIRGYGIPAYTEEAAQPKEPEPKPVAPQPAPPAPSSSIDPARSKDKALAGTWVTTSSLHLRAGAGTDKKKITVIPRGGQVKNYGYYTEWNGTKWLLVTYKNYKGFCSSKYLKKK